MRAIRTCVFAMLFAACGGGGESKKPDALIIIPDAAPDAPPDAFEPVFDFTCMGNAEPTTAAANVTVSGFASEVVVSGMQPTIQAAHSAAISICNASSTTCTGQDELDTLTTPDSGCPQMGCPFTSDPLATGGTPLDLYVRVSKSTNWTSYIYPASPVTANAANVPAAMFSQGVITGLALAGIVTQDETKGILLVALTDCANAPITDTENITLSVKQNGMDVQDTDLLDLGMYAPELAGSFAVFNVPAGPSDMDPAVATEVGATYKGTAMRAHVVNVYRNSTTATQLRPGF